MVNYTQKGKLIMHNYGMLKRLNLANFLTTNKTFTNRCAETQLNETVSQLLCALLQRLTDLERHEQYLRACQHHPTNGTEAAENKVRIVFMVNVERISLLSVLGKNMTLLVSSIAMVDSLVRA